MPFLGQPSIVTFSRGRVTVSCPYVGALSHPACKAVYSGDGSDTEIPMKAKRTPTRKRYYLLIMMGLSLCALVVAGLSLLGPTSHRVPNFYEGQGFQMSDLQ